MILSHIKLQLASNYNYNSLSSYMVYSLLNHSLHSYQYSIKSHSPSSVSININSYSESLTHKDLILSTQIVYYSISYANQSINYTTLILITKLSLYFTLNKINNYSILSLQKLIIWFDISSISNDNKNARTV
jgi:hypothetical protein